jgi:predicted nucleotidyltransferase
VLCERQQSLALGPCFEDDMLSETEIARIRSVLLKRSEIDYGILFGSSLKRLLPQSDVDLLVGGDVDENLKDDLSVEMSIGLKRPVDIVLTKEARCEVVLKAFSSGLPVLVRDRVKVKEDYFKNYRLCDENRSLKRIRLERLKRVYGNGS